ncbi:MAG: tetratricopeptide repeat protein [Deltaproteobacteria bacterium]|nr:MAG: tetratricopeptide repeat protein [Deltaproteobacteria bacterium]
MRRMIVPIVLCLFVLVSLSCGKKEKEYTSYPSGGGSIDLEAYQKIESLKKIVSKDRNNRKAWVMLGNLYFDANQNAEAVKAYREALRLDPNDPNVLTDMGICLRRLGRADEAIEAFRAAIRLKRDHYQSRYNLGLTLLHDKNDLQGALSAWEELLENVPSFPGRDNLAQRVEALKKMTTEMPAGESHKGETKKD